jgi:hypothetical protein
VVRTPYAGRPETCGISVLSVPGPQREDRARDVLDILLLDMLAQLNYH